MVFCTQFILANLAGLPSPVLLAIAINCLISHIWCGVVLERFGGVCQWARDCLETWKMPRRSLHVALRGSGCSESYRKLQKSTESHREYSERARFALSVHICTPTKYKSRQQAITIFSPFYSLFQQIPSESYTWQVYISLSTLFTVDHVWQWLLGIGCSRCLRCQSPSLSLSLANKHTATIKAF